MSRGDRLRPTIYDVAKDANVSVASISRVLEGKPSVTPEIRERVQKSIKKLGYVPNKAARNLARRKTELIGLITTKIANPFFGALAMAAEQAAREEGYTLLLSNTNGDSGQERQSLHVMVRVAVAGILWVPSLDKANRPLAAEVSRTTPIVTIDDRLEECDSVCVDHLSGVTQIIDHLRSHGHRHIAYIGGPTPKRDHFRHVMSTTFRIGPSESLTFNDDAYPSWADLCSDLLSVTPRPTALWTHNDRAAVRLYDALETLSIQIPNGISVVGYDDTELAQALRPRLTTVAQSAEELGFQAVNVLMRRIQETNIPRMHVQLQPQLVIRESTGPVLPSRAVSGDLH